MTKKHFKIASTALFSVVFTLILSSIYFIFILPLALPIAAIGPLIPTQLSVEVNYDNYYAVPLNAIVLSPYDDEEHLIYVVLEIDGPFGKEYRLKQKEIYAHRFDHMDGRVIIYYVSEDYYLPIVMNADDGFYDGMRVRIILNEEEEKE